MAILDTTKDLSALFKQQVQRTPDAIALEDPHCKYTYSELEGKVDELAQQLRHHGVERDSLVGVLLPRSADYVIACLAAIRAGGAFLVLELAYPRDLLTDVLEDAQPAVVVTYRAEVGKIKEGVSLVVLDDHKPTANGHAVRPAEEVDETDLDKLCFVAYSSGTTGKPKGIANPHRAPVLSYDLRFGVSDLKPGDRVACNVFFVWEIIRPLLRGATTVAVPDEVSYDPVALVELLKNQKATETLMTPTLLSTVLSRRPNLGKLLPDLKTLWLNGEVVTADLAKRAHKALPNARLLNVYSACETHEVACGDITKMLDDEMVYCPVGPLLDPEHVYVLDEEGNRVEPGTSGELYVGGALLARGYLNLPDATAAAFTKDEFHDEESARKYRTGDLARILPSGLLEITGRVGSMIKLRGWSVVPAKVEDAIINHLAVSSCVVVGHGEGVDKLLVAYVVRDKDGSDDRPVLEIDQSGRSPKGRRALNDYLAQYMLPSIWVEMEQLPTHEVSGKIDTKALPPPFSTNGVEGSQGGTRDPVNTDSVAEIWSETLHVSRKSIKPEDGFFDLGGHSLSLAELGARLSRAFGIRIPIARLADPVTLQGHVHTVRQVRDGQIAAVQADLPAALREDSVFDQETIVPKNLKMQSLKEAKTVLLTGATGFLGAFLLSDLLEGTNAHIICMVRFREPNDADVGAGVARLRKNLIDLGLWRDQIMERVEILPGNLERRRLGLSHDKFTELGERVDVIVHAAATVNLVYPYAALRAANVGGTREILRLACIKGATVQYVSTNGVLPPSPSGAGWPEDAMIWVDSVPDKIPDGYGQTKWAAEQLVYEAGRRGLPVRILRAGTISGHSATGAANAWDLLTALFVESIHLGYAPDVEGWRAEVCFDKSVLICMR